MKQKVTQKLASMSTHLVFAWTHKINQNVPWLASVGIAGVIIGTGLSVPAHAAAPAGMSPYQTYVSGQSVLANLNQKPRSNAVQAPPSSAIIAKAVPPTTTDQITSVAKVMPTAKTSSQWGSMPLYVDPDNSASNFARTNPGATSIGIINKLGQQPTAQWFGGWNPNVQTDVNNYVTKAAAAGAMPVLVAYNIPNRDCGGYSSGGASSESAYALWIQQFSNGIGNRPATVILEPDGVTLQSCLSTDLLAARNRELSGAVMTIAANSRVHVYLDAGHSDWLGVASIASRLQAAGVSGAAGFSLNVSNFGTTAANTAYGTQVSALLNEKHFVIDTSRNGVGPTQDNQWCNPAGRALGNLPTSQTGNVLVDAYLWIKSPLESDGSCNGHPGAGQIDLPYAISLAQAAGW